MLTEKSDSHALSFGGEIFETIERSHAKLGEALHDTLCQTLSGAALMARVLARRAASGEAATAAELAQISAMLDRSLDGARALLHVLQPLPAGPTGLMTALQRLSSDTALTVPCEFRCEEPVLLEHSGAGLALYRIAAEAIRNALGPTPATHVRISLAAPDGAVEVVVWAFGSETGGALAEDRLKLMHYRAIAIGAEMTCEALAEGGTRLACRLSLEAER